MLDWDISMCFAIWNALRRGYHLTRLLTLSRFSLLHFSNGHFLVCHSRYRSHCTVLWWETRMIFWFWDVLAQKQPTFAVFRPNIENYSISLHSHRVKLVFVCNFKQTSLWRLNTIEWNLFRCCWAADVIVGIADLAIWTYQNLWITVYLIVDSQILYTNKFFYL